MTRTGWIVLVVAAVVVVWTRCSAGPSAHSAAPPAGASTSARLRPAVSPPRVAFANPGCDMAELRDAVTDSVQASLDADRASGDDGEAEPTSVVALERAGAAVEEVIASGYLDGERAGQLRSTLSELDPGSRMELELELARAVNAGDLELSGPEALPL